MSGHTQLFRLAEPVGKALTNHGIDLAWRRDPLVAFAAFGGAAIAFATAPTVPSGIARGAFAFFVAGAAVFCARRNARDEYAWS